MRDVRVHRWFVTAQFARVQQVRRGREWRAVWSPSSPTHAKQMGTARTACGLVAETWPKMWDVGFAGDRIGACPACSDVVAGRRPCPV